MAVNKLVITQENLTFDIGPNGFFIDPRGDELEVFFCRFGPRSAELTEYPVSGEAGMRLLLTRSGQVTGPFPVSRILHHACADRVQDDIAADFQRGIGDVVAPVALRN